MIIEYHRPNTLEEAITLLSRSHPDTRPIAGGTQINQPDPQEFAVVDLQKIGLSTIEKIGATLVFGATVTLQSVLEWIKTYSEDNKFIAEALSKALLQETTYNLRHMASVAGTIVAADGRSGFTACCLALDTELMVLPENEKIKLGDLLPLRKEKLRGRLISQLVVPVNVRLSYATISRTQTDRPIICVAITAWTSGRRRVVLGGFGKQPILVFDGNEANGAEIAARSAYSTAGDEWATAEYRAEMATILTKRCLDELID
jgi:CO/xanthine dehydrogenase FAD-binding subunit